MIRANHTPNSVKTPVIKHRVWQFLLSDKFPDFPFFPVEYGIIVGVAQLLKKLTRPYLDRFELSSALIPMDRFRWWSFKPGAFFNEKQHHLSRLLGGVCVDRFLQKVLLGIKNLQCG
jgi:hypothetical protein